MKKEVLLVSVDFYGRKEYHEATETPTSYNLGWEFVKKDTMFKDGKTYKVATNEDLENYKKHLQEEALANSNDEVKELIVNLERIKELVNEKFVEINNDEIEEEIKSLISELKDILNIDEERGVGKNDLY